MMPENVELEGVGPTEWLCMVLPIGLVLLNGGCPFYVLNFYSQNISLANPLDDRTDVAMEHSDYGF